MEVKGTQRKLNRDSHILAYTVGEEKLGRFRKACIDVVSKARIIYNIQEKMHMDVHAVGNTFSWSNGDGTARSRLEIFLMTCTWWKVNGQVVGDKYLADHSPIWMISNNLDRGSKPFKPLSCVYEHKELLSFVKKE